MCASCSIVKRAKIRERSWLVFEGPVEGRSNRVVVLGVGGPCCVCAGDAAKYHGADLPVSRDSDGAEGTTGTEACSVETWDWDAVHIFYLSILVDF